MSSSTNTTMPSKNCPSKNFHILFSKSIIFHMSLCKHAEDSRQTHIAVNLTTSSQKVSRGGKYALKKVRGASEDSR
jgi:hypothetical protein